MGFFPDALPIFEALNSYLDSVKANPPTFFFLLTSSSDLAGLNFPLFPDFPLLYFKGDISCTPK